MFTNILCSFWIFHKYNLFGDVKGLFFNMISEIIRLYLYSFLYTHAHAHTHTYLFEISSHMRLLISACISEKMSFAPLNQGSYEATKVNLHPRILRNLLVKIMVVDHPVPAPTLICWHTGSLLAHRISNTACWKDAYHKKWNRRFWPFYMTHSVMTTVQKDNSSCRSDLHSIQICWSWRYNQMDAFPRHRHLGSISLQSISHSIPIQKTSLKDIINFSIIFWF